MTTVREQGPPRWAWLVVVATWALCYLPSFSLAEFDKEESRRAVPAREMLASGDFVLPTVWGRPYLAKPPLYYWTVAGTAAVTGEVDTFSARLPAVLATLFTALALYFLGRRIFDAASGLTAALVFLLSLGVFEKGALGELEATLCLYTCLATGLLWIGRDGSRAALIGCAAALAASALTKGPVGFLFFGAAAAAIAIERRSWRFLVSAPVLVPLIAAGAALGSWVLLVLQRVDQTETLAHWSGELARANDSAASLYLRDRARFVSGTLLAFFPGSLVCLVLLRSWRRELRSTAGERFLALALLLALGVLFLQPGVRPRFAYAALPWCALFAGRLLTQARIAGLVSARGPRALAIVLAVLGFAVAAASVWVFKEPIDGVGPFTPLGYVATAALAVLSFATLQRARRRFDLRTLAYAAGVLVLVRFAQVTEIVPQSARARTSEAVAAKIDAFVPTGATIEVRFWGRFNELSPVRHELRYAELDAPVTAGSYVLAYAEERVELPRNGDLIATLDLGGGKPVVLLRYE